MTFGYVHTRNAVYVGTATQRVTAGEHELGLHIRKTSESSAIATLTVDSELIGEVVLPNMWPIYAANAGIRCGENRHAPVTRAYDQPFVFDQQLKRVVVDVDMG